MAPDATHHAGGLTFEPAAALPAAAAYLDAVRVKAVKVRPRALRGGRVGARRVAPRVWLSHAL
jgi:hypothetical protein